jgi:tRNA threonylcarbamoyladenosine biosynthesis protein TsaE
MEEKIIVIKNEEETKKFGRELSEKLSPGSIIALTGDLGTGKTALTKAIAEGLGVKEMITSPTFNIVRQYDSGRLPLYHFDVYRIGDVDEMYELGYEEYFFGEGVCVIEWADIIEEIIPEDAIRIEIEYGEKEGERIYRCLF